MWLCNTEVTAACQNTELMCDNVMTCVSVWGGVSDSFTTSTAHSVLLQTVEGGASVCYCSTIRERVNVVIHDAATEHLNDSETFIMQNFVVWFMRLSDIMFYVFIVFCSSSCLCSFGKHLIYKFTVSVRIIIHEEHVTEALYLAIFSQTYECVQHTEHP